MTNNDTPDIHVSYSRKYEKESKLLASLQKTLTDIKFGIDVAEVKNRRSFDTFIAEIGAAEFVIVVLSEDYLKSFYCVYELLSVYKNGNLNEKIELTDRVLFIRQDGFQLDVDVLRQQLTEYWQTIKTHRKDNTTHPDYDDRGSLSEVAEIVDNWDALFTLIHRRQSPEAGIITKAYDMMSSNALQQSCFDPIREWLEIVSGVAKLRPRAKLEPDIYIEQIRKNINQSLRPHTNLVELLAEDLGCEAKSSAVTERFTGCQDFGSFLNRDIRAACVQAINDAGRESTDLISDIWNIISWSLCLAAPITDLTNAPVNNSSHKVAALHGANSTTRLAYLGAMGRASPTLDINDSRELHSLDHMYPSKTTTWDEGSGLHVQNFVWHVYVQVFGRDFKAKNEIFDDHGNLHYKERVLLMEEMQGAAERGTAYFHTILNYPDSSTFLSDEKTVLKIQAQMPALDLYQCVNRFNQPTLRAKSEGALHNAFTTFFNDVLGGLKA